MNVARQISRQELIRRFKKLGYIGPFSGGRHQFMQRGKLKLRIPNPHVGDVHISLLREITDDKGVPRNIKELINESVNVLCCDKPSNEKISCVVSILDDASNDPNVSGYTRTQIWSIVSILENYKD